MTAEFWASCAAGTEELHRYGFTAIRKLLCIQWPPLIVAAFHYNGLDCHSRVHRLHGNEKKWKIDIHSVQSLTLVWNRKEHLIEYWIINSKSIEIEYEARTTHGEINFIIIYLHLRNSFVRCNVGADYVIGLFSPTPALYNKLVLVLACVQMCRTKRSSDKIITSFLISQWSFWPREMSPFEWICGRIAITITR